MMFFLIGVILSAAGICPVADTVCTLPEVEITQSKDGNSLLIWRQAQQVDAFAPAEMNALHVETPKDMSAAVPNLSMPDYGSAMTSSVYVRGMGSRIDEPVIGMVVDGLPILDKNLYDSRLQDVRRLEFLRGPQGTMYGRNTMGGVMEIHTLQPLDITGQQLHAALGYSFANTMEAHSSFYSHHSDRFAWSIAARYNRTDGFYINSYDGSRVDYGQSAGGRLILDGHVANHWRITNTIALDWVNQGAFPYAAATTGDIRYNDRGAYRRLGVITGLKAVREDLRQVLSIMATYQYLNDHMQMDNDYTARPIFTLEQRQGMHAAMAEGIWRSKRLKPWYDCQVGASFFFKHNDSSAPVTFLRDGIDNLILSNANRGIHNVFPNDSLEIEKPYFVIANDFRRLNIGAALYHQSEFRPIPNLTLRLGVRLDVEHAAMTYSSHADIHYRFTFAMKQPKSFTSALKGNIARTYVQLLPRLTVQYDFPRLTVYAYASKGSKAGGYNTQIFSTIVQNRMMRDLMADLHVYMDGVDDERYTRADITQYKPETAWTMEIGTHWTPVTGLRMSADVFYVSMRDQQLTVFPQGKTTGRMMSNAARSFSTGAEATLFYRWQFQMWQGQLRAAYGFTEARFRSFQDGVYDYSGNRIPYVPRHTMLATTSVSYRVDKPWLKSLTLTISTEGKGSIAWTEANNRIQSFYALMNASLSLMWNDCSLILWSKNLTDTNYDVFYFVSMDNPFLQRGKPRQFGLTFALDL